MIDHILDTDIEVKKFKPWVDRVVAVIGSNNPIYDDTCIEDLYSGDLTNRSKYSSWVKQISDKLGVYIEELDYIWVIAENLKLKEEK